MTFAEAVACGKILIQVKELTKHGGWLEWLRQYAKYSDRTAQRRMGLARNATQLSNVSNLTPKNIATGYVGMGVIKPQNYNKGKKPHAAKSDFLKVKGWANHICALLLKTDDKKRMANAPIFHLSACGALKVWEKDQTNLCHKFAAQPSFGILKCFPLLHQIPNEWFCTPDDFIPFETHQLVNRFLKGQPVSPDFFRQLHIAFRHDDFFLGNISLCSVLSELILNVFGVL
jgi:Protein of unknown function (DUF3102)